MQKSEYVLTPHSTPGSLHPCLGLCLLSHILTFPCPPAAGPSCCGPVSMIPGLVPGPVAGSSIPTDKDGDCPAQFLVLPGQRQHAGDSRGQVRASGPTRHTLSHPGCCSVGAFLEHCPSPEQPGAAPTGQPFTPRLETTKSRSSGSRAYKKPLHTGLNWEGQWSRMRLY